MTFTGVYLPAESIGPHHKKSYDYVNYMAFMSDKLHVHTHLYHCCILYVHIHTYIYAPAIYLQIAAAIGGLQRSVIHGQLALSVNPDDGQHVARYTETSLQFTSAT